MPLNFDDEEDESDEDEGEDEGDPGRLDLELT